MTNATWHVRNRYFVAVTDDHAADPVEVTFFHSTNPAFAGQALPWAEPEYPSLLLLGIGFRLVTDATAGNRRVVLGLTQPGGAAATIIVSSATQPPGANRRWEFWAGFELDTTAIGTIAFKEPLPRGLVMLSPRDANQSEARLDITLLGSPGAGSDTIEEVTMSGHLLYP